MGMWHHLAMRRKNLRLLLYLAMSLHLSWLPYRWCCRPAAQSDREERAESTLCDHISPHCYWVLKKKNFGGHLMLKSEVQLVLPSTQDMQESKASQEWFFPPQTTSLPPDRSERLWLSLTWGRSGMEQVWERGNSSTLVKMYLSFLPPTTTCPEKDV